MLNKIYITKNKTQLNKKNNCFEFNSDALHKRHQKQQKACLPLPLFAETNFESLIKLFLNLKNVKKLNIENLLEEVYDEIG